MNKLERPKLSHASQEEYEKLWLESVQQLAENAELKKRIERLEREIACHAFGGWTIH